MTSKELRKVQLCQLDLAVEVKRICEKHNLKFTLAYGSMLGAVRHKGFIPWDDDLDIAMLRSDYEKFIDICKSDLDNQYILCTTETDENYGNYFAQLRIKDTVYGQKICENADVEKGIFIDIFPFDFCSENKMVQYIQFNFFKMLKIAFLTKNNYKISKHQILQKIVKAFCYFLSSDLIIKMMNKIALKRKEGKLICNFAGPYKSRECMPRSYFDFFELCKFENQLLPILSDSKKVLTQWYGDYMILPPPEKRENRHEIIKVDFGEYKIKSL